ncbi:MarR family transcriptional regulator [Caballeronia fortuita]|uniref:MarR family transcriptional regulator n=1 Tax=Caballeronia fortuita TaxID=1777138 RepID=A0A158A706_9BURK|nr:MarR family transcriptional regulator [Caballeronia fortuita]SAK53553.1 MarR family transcriptional regulator [Caballeronia fortuita]
MQLSFAIYGLASRMARLHKPFLEPLGLTFPQYLAMLELYTGTPRYVSDLGNSLGMDTGTITPLLKRMEVQGLVTRTRDPKDERRVLVSLTAKGEELKAQVWGVCDSIDGECPLSAREVITLRDTLNGLLQPDQN